MAVKRAVNTYIVTDQSDHVKAIHAVLELLSYTDEDYLLEPVVPAFKRMGPAESFYHPASGITFRATECAELRTWQVQQLV